MAELEPAPTACRRPDQQITCCAPDQQITCCEQEQKADCCASDQPARCGCAAGLRESAPKESVT
jgi:hypothetical protein